MTNKNKIVFINTVDLVNIKAITNVLQNYFIFLNKKQKAVKINF
tara:strand:- start:7604 stop:7735 length:132 start_codon:yes stop_codon:yes gene_type:complete